VSLQPFLEAQGVNAQFVQRERHVRVAETTIRRIKDAVRATIHGLPYKLPHSLYKDLITYCVESVNMTYSVRNDVRTCEELFCGKKLDMSSSLRVAFGELVITYRYTKERQRTDEPRGELGLVLGRDPKCRGGALILLLDGAASK
jgi:hypothetical protein